MLQWQNTDASLTFTEGQFDINVNIVIILSAQVLKVEWKTWEAEAEEEWEAGGVEVECEVEDEVKWEAIMMMGMACMEMRWRLVPTFRWFDNLVIQ